MRPTEIRRRIMSQATEDLTGLWELPATHGAPGVDEVIAVLSDLIRKDFITVYTGTLFESEETPLPAAAAQKAIRDKRFWDWSAPERGVHLRALATPAGHAWYFGQGREARASAMERR
jgi:hypothetical protein